MTPQTDNNPSRIDYTGNAAQSLATYSSVQFSYTARTDIVPVYQAGSVSKTTVLLTNIKTYSGAQLVTDYRLAYTAATSAASHDELTSITRCDGGGVPICLAPTTFGWQGSRDTLPLTAVANSLSQNATLDSGQFTGDGLTDALLNGSTANCGFYAGTQANTFVLSSLYASFTYWSHDTGTWQPVSFAGACLKDASDQPTHIRPRLFDINGDGLTDILIAVRTGASSHDLLWLLNTTTALVDTYGQPSYGARDYGDFNGDGRSDLLATISGGSGEKIQLSTGVTFGTPSATTYTGVRDIDDFDGDGCSDLLTTQVVFFCNPAVATASVPSWTGTPVYADFNGDGKTDILVVYPSAAGVLYLSSGTGFITSSFVVPSDWGKYNIIVGDWNGDGKADIALIAPGGTGKYGVGTSHKIFLSTGSGFNQITTIANTNSADTSVGAVVADWNNDGASDIWLKKPSGDTEILFSYQPELLTTVNNGIGRITTAPYDRLNKNGSFYTKDTTAAYPTQDVDAPKYVVSQLSASNGIGGQYVTNYSYAGAKLDLAGRGFLGFSSITIADLQTGITSVTNYRLDYPFIGLISLQTATHGATQLSSTSNTYNATNLGGVANFVSLTQSVLVRNDLNGAALPTVTTSFTYDSYGNPLTTSAALSDGSSRVATNTFTNDTGRWILGQQDTASIQSIVGSSNLTRQFSFAHDATTGLFTQEVVEPSTPALRLQADISYDVFGNRNGSTLSGIDIQTRSNSLGFDSKGQFATSSTNALLQGESFTYNPDFGTQATHTDLNGHITVRSYDSFGRQTLESRPDGRKTATTYLYCAGVNGGTASCPSGGAYLVQITPYANDGATQNGPQSEIYYDMLDREVARDTQGFDGSWIRQSTQYDALERVSNTSRPYFLVGGTAKWTAYDYDDLNRITKVTVPDASHSDYAYNGLSSSITNDKGQITTTSFNAQGLVAAIKDALDPSDPGHHTTTYIYDAFGALTQVVDPASNTTGYTYDIRGRRTAASDPDMGNWTYGYDVLSELVSQTDAKMQNTTLAYDKLGRLISRIEPGLSSQWSYDPTNGLGELAQACATNGCLSTGYIRTPSYDGLSRLSSTETKIDGSAYTYGITYKSVTDPNVGRIDTITYPSGLTLKYIYTSLGYLSQIKDDTSGVALWTANARDAELHLLSQTSGNGVATTQAFDPNTGNLLQIAAGPSNSIASFAYTWDTIGNLTTRSDTLQPLSETFGYDQLNRLTTYQVGTYPAKSASYDALGNITKKSDVCTAANCFVYGAGATMPHALTSIVGSYNGVTNPVFSYDPNGNLTSGAGRSATWTSFNKVASLTQASSSAGFVYDSEHNRIKQCVPDCTSPTSTTTYLNDSGAAAMSEKVVSGATTTWRDYIVIEGGIVAERFNTAGALSWRYFISDHLSSTAVLTDAAGAVQERLSYDAWGKRRNVDGTDSPSCSITSVTNRGFTGHEMLDSFCLINMSARIYDPSLGRFAAADALMPKLYDGQSWNRFSYVNNRPLSLIDPSGNDDQPPAKAETQPHKLRWGDPDTWPVPDGEVPGPPPGMPSGPANAPAERFISNNLGLIMTPIGSYSPSRAGAPSGNGGPSMSNPTGKPGPYGNLVGTGKVSQVGPVNIATKVRVSAGPGDEFTIVAITSIPYSAAGPVGSPGTAVPVGADFQVLEVAVPSGSSVIELPNPTELGSGSIQAGSMTNPVANSVPTVHINSVAIVEFRFSATPITSTDIAVEIYEKPPS